MKKIAIYAAALTFSMAPAAALTAQAQTAAAAPAAVNLDVGTMVFDSAGAEIGKVVSNDGTHAVIAFGDAQIAMPVTSFGTTDAGTALGLTVDQLAAGIAQQKAAAEAALNESLQPGATVHALNGSATLGTIKTVEADAVVLTTAEGDVRLPKSAFFQAAHGLSTSFTADQFKAALAEMAANNDAAPQAEAAADQAAAAE